MSPPVRAGAPPDLGDVRLGVARGATYGLHQPAEPFLPTARALGAGLVRVTLYWSQIEPEPGRFVWDTVDALLGQLDGDDEVFVTVAASSTWATRVATPYLPPSPALDPDRYRGFVDRLVRRAAGAVRYWQCETEPCVPLLWSGTPDEYVAQLAVFSAAVRAADPAALVVLGGAVPAAMVADSLGADPAWAAGMARIVAAAGEHVDVFDLHPYGDPYAVPALVTACRDLMAKHGYRRPVVAGEYNGPMPTAFRDNLPYLGEVLDRHRAVFLGRAAVPGGGVGAPPDDPAMRRLYRRAAELPATLRMFLAGAPAHLVARRDALVRRDLVVRTVLLLAAGVRRAVCFQLAPEKPEPDRYTVPALMFGAMALTDYDGAAIGRPRPAAATFALLAHHLDGARGVRRRELPGHPDVHLYDVDRGRRAPLLVAWRREDGPAADVDLPWPYRGAAAVDALGASVPVPVAGDRIRLPVSATPLLVDTGDLT